MLLLYIGLYTLILSREAKRKGTERGNEGGKERRLAKNEGERPRADKKHEATLLLLLLLLLPLLLPTSNGPWVPIEAGLSS